MTANITLEFLDEMLVANENINKETEVLLFSIVDGKPTFTVVTR